MKLVQYVGLWTLVHHPARPNEWSLDRKLRSIKSEGFEGVAARLDFPIASLAAKHGLAAFGQIFPSNPGEYARLLRAQKDFGSRHVSVELGNHDTTPAEGIRHWLTLEKEAHKLGLDVSLEVHRDTMTESPEKLFELADRYEKQTKRTLRLTWDFSHWAVAKHLLTGQFVERLLSRPELIQHARFFHFRPFNAHHAQLPITSKGKLTPEVRDYLDFAQEVMHIWKIAPDNGDSTLYACPSLGPKGGYALSNFPAVWPDALVLSRELEARWKKAR